MTNRTTHHVIYRRNRTIYRRKVKNLYTSRDADCIFVWNSVRIAWGERLYLALSRGNVRAKGKFARSITLSRRRHDGFRANILFAISTAGNRQARKDTPSRNSLGKSRDSWASVCDWSRGSSRNPQSFGLGEKARSKPQQTSGNHEASALQRQREHQFMNKLISITEQGRSVREGFSDTDGAQTLCEIFAANCCIYESGTTLFSESICTDARY